MFGSKKPMRVSPDDKLGFFVFKHHKKMKKGKCPRIIVSTDRTPLHICIQKGYASCAQLLVNAGADLDEPGKNGQSATRHMLSKRHTWVSWWPETHVREAKEEDRARSRANACAAKEGGEPSEPVAEENETHMNEHETNEIAGDEQS